MRNQKIKNPLLNREELPLFLEIKPQHVSPAISYLLNNNREKINEIKVSSDELTWDNFLIPLQRCDEELSRAWSQVSHLNAVLNSPELREEYNKNILEITKYYSELSQDEIIYKKFIKLKNSSIYNSFSKTQKKIVEDELLSFTLGGVDLPLDKKQEFKKIQEQLSTLSTRFEENLLDSINDFQLNITSENRLSGLPEDIIHMAKCCASENQLKGWVFTLDFPCYVPTLQYANDRELRREMYYAYSTKASDLADPEHDNSQIINDILNLKHQMAKILNFPNYAAMSLKTKMAKSSGEVINFLDSLASKAKKFAELDMSELYQAASKDGIDKIEAWDISYYSEKIKQEKFNFSDQEIKNYFPKNKVLMGLFDLVEKIYSIYITRKEAQVWNEFVEFYEIRDKDDCLIGQFYLDLYARKNKRGGAWMDEAISRYKFTSESSTPVAFLTCNFTPPIVNKPITLTHDEVITLFHEFGHGLHHLLTEIDEYSVSGIKGVEWDAVELPSQFMENFCWEWSVIKNMTQHIETKQSISKELFDKLYTSKNFQSGLQTLR